MTFCCGSKTECVRIFDVPGRLSGDILRIKRNLPPVAGHYEIDGDEIRPLDRCLEYPDAIGDDSEDVSDLLAPLPLVDVNPDKHFVKQPKYRSEIENLVLCQGGQVPGTPLSPSIIQLLGKSADGKLVFDIFVTSAFTLGRFSSLATYKSWVLQLIDCLEALHSVGIVHRDFRADNFVFSRDGRRLVIIDLDSRWGVRAAPEIAPIGGLDDSGWSTKSDIYDIGNCTKSMVYANQPIPFFVEWPVPAPLQAIVDTCMRPNPQDRPTLAQLRSLVEGIEDSNGAVEADAGALAEPLDN
jgi:serine/threonine protein kinase